MTSQELLEAAKNNEVIDGFRESHFLVQAEDVIKMPWFYVEEILPNIHVALVKPLEKK
jgi:hypothetical protein